MAVKPGAINLPEGNSLTETRSLSTPIELDNDIIVRSFSGADEILFGDFGEIASQLSTVAVSGEFPAFLAASADDFRLDPINSGTIDYHITKVSACFTPFINQLPIDSSISISTLWKGAYIIVLSDSNNQPAREFDMFDIEIFGGLTDENTEFSWGQHDPQPGSATPAPDPIFICNATDLPPIAGTEPIVALQYVPLANITITQAIGEIPPDHGSYWTADIPVSFYLSPNIKYWIMVMPRHVGTPQSAWCLSSVNRTSDALRGATFFDPNFPDTGQFWSTFGNFGFVPPPNGFRNLAYSVIGKERRCI